VADVRESDFRVEPVSGRKLHGGGYCQSLSDQSVNASVNVNSSANSRPSLRTNLSNSDSPSPMSGTSSSGSSTHHSHTIHHLLSLSFQA